MRYFGIILIGIALYLFFAYRKPKNVKQIGGDEAKAMQEAGATIVDVRSKREFDEGHIPGSINIPIGSSDFIPMLPKDRNSPIIVYCRSGARASSFEKTILQEGYTNLYHLGSLNKWTGPIE